MMVCATAFATTTAELLAPQQHVDIGGISASDGVVVTRDDDGWMLQGPGDRPAVIVMTPPGGAWDFDAFNHLRIDCQNHGQSLVRIEAVLENDNPLAWARSLPGAAVLPARTPGTIGFSFTRPGNTYDGPDVFSSQSARPNGHRTHWRPFSPRDVRAIRLHLTSSGPFKLKFGIPALCWPAGSDANIALEAMPYLDHFGQTRALGWPGKINSAAQLIAALNAENAAFPTAGNSGLNQFGGWADGPLLESTGMFRVEKFDGRWWFVDPEGRLFWSHGANSVGAGAATPVTPSREGFFAWLPDADDPLHEVMMQMPRSDGPVMADFLAANATRAWGGDAPEKRRDLDHRRLRGWGLNTLGAWSTEEMMRDRRTVYTLTTGVWWPVLHRSGGHVLPDPFDPEFEHSLRRALEGLAWARGDKWCLGVFVDNELEWSNDLAPLLFASSEGQPARRAFIAHLENRYDGIHALNEAWGGDFDSWEKIAALGAPPAGLGNPGAFASEMLAFYDAFAEQYFMTCRRLINELLPGHLYLGCRIHRAPEPVIRAATRHVDVFSVNRYEALAAASMLPNDADIPVLITEFHFGAPDRGVPGTGLRGVHDQAQRGLAYAAYVAGGLLDPRVVGTHWFAWPDQSAAGRPGENYQIGFIDVTGRGYPEFTATVRQLAHQLYPLRRHPPASVEQALDELFSPTQLEQ